MTTEDQLQSSTIEQSYGPEDDEATCDNDNETAAKTSTNTSERPVRRCRFFRSKRKQRIVDEKPSDVESNNVTSEKVIDSVENSEEPTNDACAAEISIIVTNAPNEKSGAKRMLVSPPPSPPSTDDTDETDASTNSDDSPFTAQVESRNVEEKIDLTKRRHTEKLLTSPSTLCAPSIFGGYQRKKSQSVKLTHVDRIDSYPKKNVRFADDFGLDLSQVKVIKSDELPHVPSAAFKDLHISNEENSTSIYQERTKVITYLEQQFENPIHALGFEDRVLRHKVALEQANAIDNRIYGTIKIFSFGLNKRVKIRLTSDNWITFNDHNAIYITDSYDGTFDRFTFTLEIDRDRICLGNNIQFCVGYESYVGSDFWDNNYQQNYRFDCVTRTIPDYSS